MYKIKNNKILGINLSHKVNNLYAENNKTLMKEIFKNTNVWKESPCSWFGRPN